MDVYCPSCGYNLHGIPELRCPECGFGFDRPAVEATARSEFYRDFWTCRAVIVRSVFAAALALPAVLDLLRCPSDVLPFVAGAGLGFACFVRQRFGQDGAADLLDWLAGVRMSVVFALVGAILLSYAPSAGTILAAACLVDAALIWVRGRRRYEFTPKTLPPEAESRLSRYRIGAMVSSLVAVGTWLTSIVG